LPEAQIATAMPRRRSNQWLMSASKGLKEAELPRNPIRIPCTSAKAHTLVASAESA
jgi:hypothetical protein